MLSRNCHVRVWEWHKYDIEQAPGDKGGTLLVSEIASLARKHNDANVLVLPARFIAPEEAIKIVDTFLSTAFEGGRHLRRIEKIPVK